MVDIGFGRPALEDLIARAEASVNARLPEADARLQRSALSVLVHVLSGQTHGLYSYLDYIARQAIIDTADTDSLDRWGRVWGIDRKPASRTEGNAVFTGIDTVVVPAGAQLQTANGEIYEVVEDRTVESGEVLLPLRALSGGSDANAAAGASITFISPIGGVNLTGAVDAGGLAGGAGVETDAALRGRLLQRIQNPPQGGAAEDYVAWALSRPGVTRAWVSSGELGRGTVTVRFMMDQIYGDGLPLPADVTEMEDYLRDRNRRPVTAEVYAAAPVAFPVNMTIQGLSPGTADVQSAVIAELTDMFQRDAVPSGTIHVSRIWEAVSLASGESSHFITAPVTDVIAPTGHLPLPGTVTFA